MSVDELLLLAAEARGTAPEESATLLRRAIRLAPSNAQAHLMISELYTFGSDSSRPRPDGRAR